MKKTTKILGILFVASALFMGCKQNAPEETTKPDISGALFSEDETTITTTTVSFAAGNWTIRSVQKETGSDGEMIIAAELNCTVNDNRIDTTADHTFKFSMSHTLDHDPTDEEKAEAESSGATLEGRTGTIYKEYNKQQIAELGAKTNRTEPEDFAVIMYSDFIAMGSDPTSMTSAFNFKTNSDNSKYLAVPTDPDSTQKIYFAKN